MNSAREYVAVPAPLPTSLIIYPCAPLGAGSTVDSLTKAYVENTYCIGRYKGVVDSIAEYNNKIKEMGKE